MFCKKIAICLAVLFCCLPAFAAEVVVKKILPLTASSGNNLAVFEKAGAHGKGFTKDGNEFVCANDTQNGQSGVLFSIPLNQTAAAPIFAEGWSKAENVNGSASSADYGLYIDIIYADGSHLWGESNAFSTGTHDWERKNLFVMPEKPVKSLSFYALFRNKSGNVRFKDLKLTAAEVDPTVTTFDGIPVQVQQAGSPGTISCQLRDVAASSDFLQLNVLEPNKVTNPLANSVKGITSSLNRRPVGGGDSAGKMLTVSLENPKGDDRCLSLVVARNCSDLTDIKFCRIRDNVSVQGEMFGPATNYQQVGVNGRQSKYPLVAIVGKDKQGNEAGFALGVDLGTPSFFRLGYNEKTSELFVVVDLALTKEMPKTTLNFVEYFFEAQHGFLGATAQYYHLFRDYFQSRTPEQGVWMPFASISKVPQFEDFGFKIKEGDSETAWDDAHNILTFRYTEPMTWWMPMPKEAARTYEAALEIVHKEAAKGNKNAQALLKCGMKTVDGTFAHQFLDTPWCVGVVWSFCDIPNIDGGGFALKWSKEIADKLYGKADGGLDGEYIDSSEGYVTAVLNFERSHFSAVRCPLVFSRDDFRPAIFRGLVAWEYVQKMSEDVHRRGKFMMANSTPDSLSWLAPWLDVMGMETNWNYDGRWLPMSDEEMMFRRILCGQKPFCFLMNTNFTKWTYEMSEKFFKRSLAYGMFPGFFSADASTGHYFENPKLYERDRPLFKKYIPICKEVAEAGWQPICGAVSNTDKVYVERFGSAADPKESFFTVFNDSGQTQQVEIRFDGTELPKKWTNRLDGKVFEMKDNVLRFPLESEDIVVLKADR